MDNFEILPLDTTIFESQASKGKNLQCFLGRMDNSKDFGSSKVDDSRKQSSKQFCMGFICKSVLNDHSDTFKCNLSNGVCTRAHLSKEEIKSGFKDIVSFLDNTRFLTSPHKTDLLEKLAHFVENN
jgi:hypothetical protein